MSLSPVWYCGLETGSDESGNVLDGSFTGSPALVAPLITNGADAAARSFNPSNPDSLQVPHNSLLNLTDTSFTILAWVNVTDFLAKRPIINKCDASNYGYQIYVHTDGKVYFFTRGGVSGNQSTPTAGAITAGVSYLIGARFDIATSKKTVWVNGVQGQTGTGIIAGTCVNANGETLKCGLDTAGYAMNGVVDEAVVYASAISDANMLLLYTTGTP